VNYRPKSALSASDLVTKRFLGVPPIVSEVILSGHASSRHAGIEFRVQLVAFRLGVFGVEGVHRRISWLVAPSRRLGFQYAR
jgi:hypothetical protein